MNFHSHKIHDPLKVIKDTIILLRNKGFKEDWMNGRDAPTPSGFGAFYQLGR